MTAPTGLLIGRFQPFHDGHRALVIRALQRVDHLLIGVRLMPRDASNPFSFEEVKWRIERAMDDFRERFVIRAIPNITHVFYGRSPGYAIEELDLPPELKAISATAIREKLRG